MPPKKASWIPDQHGAWAMLTVPFLAGTFLSPRPGWQHALLLAAWLLGYAAVFHAQQWLRLRRVAARRPQVARRHVRPALVLGAATALAGIPLAVLHPWLLLAGAAAAPFVAVNCRFALHNRERALANGLVAVVPACGMLLVAVRLGGGGTPWAPAAACLLYFAGTVPYVKTMIRERSSRTYYRGSVTYHAAATALAACLSPGWPCPSRPTWPARSPSPGGGSGCRWSEPSSSSARRPSWCRSCCSSRPGVRPPGCRTAGLRASDALLLRHQFRFVLRLRLRFGPDHSGGGTGRRPGSGVFSRSSSTAPRSFLASTLPSGRSTTRWMA